MRGIFTSDGVVVGIVDGVESLESLRPSKSEIRSHKRSHKLDRIGVGSRKNQNVSISYVSIYNFVAYDSVETTLSESEAEAQEPTNHKARNRTLCLGYSSASACDSDNTVFTRSERKSRSDRRDGAMRGMRVLLLTPSV